jgi:anti-sigma regulatory factor (Ser/Thr protein kinase)
MRALPEESWRSSANGTTAVVRATWVTGSLNSVFYSTTLPKSPSSAAQARLFLDQVRDQLDPGVFENARLLLSELIANAVEHVAEDGELEVRIALEEGALRVEVLDPGPGFVPPQRQAGSERGWGLHFTDRLASRWAADFEGRARVWFELPLSES